jgi:hypothetical protein
MNTAIQTKVSSLRVAIKTLDTVNGVVITISTIAAVVLFIVGLFNDQNLFIIGGALALGVQAYLVWALISAFVSKLELDAALGSAEI